MNEYVDIYCERLVYGLFAEPLNAITNLSFFIAALFGFLIAKKESALDARSFALITLLATVGAASALFHMTALYWAMLADSLSILFYQLAYITLYSQRVIRLSPAKTGAILGAFFLMTAAAESLPAAWLNGSLSYLPAILFLFGFGVWHALHTAREKYALLAASLIFLISLSLRSMDMAICPSFSHGTHFLWHILNGLVLYLTLRAYVIHAPRHLP